MAAVHLRSTTSRCEDHTATVHPVGPGGPACAGTVATPTSVRPKAHLGSGADVMADLLGISARIIDDGVLHEPVNRITQELSEVADGLAVVESFSHSVLFSTDEGLVAFD